MPVECQPWSASPLPHTTFDIARANTFRWSFGSSKSRTCDTVFGTRTFRHHFADTLADLVETSHSSSCSSAMASKKTGARIFAYFMYARLGIPFGPGAFPRGVSNSIVIISTRDKVCLRALRSHDQFRRNSIPSACSPLSIPCCWRRVVFKTDAIPKH